MKKVLFLITGVLLLTQSCDYLEIEPQGFIEKDKYFSDEGKVFAALVGVYTPLAHSSFYGRDWFYAFNLQDDLTYYDRNYTTEEIFINNFSYTNSRLNNLWINLYQGINRANILLENIGSVTFNDEHIRDMYIGEARFLRAYYYFILTSLWEDVPLRITASDDLSITPHIKSSPMAEVYDFVVNEMEAVIDQVADATAYDNAGRINKSVIRSILARVYMKMAGYPLNMGKPAYEKALFWALEVKSSQIHQLNTNNGGYQELFIDLAQDRYNTAHREMIWEVEFKGNNLEGHQTGGMLGSHTGILCADAVNSDTPGYCYGYASTTLKMEDLYQADDVRKNWNIAGYRYNFNATTNVRTKVDWNTSTQLVYRNAGKFRREYERVLPKHKDYTPINFPIIRYADVLLMIAEAINEIDGQPNDLAVECVDEVRNRSIPGVATVGHLPYSQFKELVQDERARELCFEGIRKQDLLRWGTYVSEMTLGRRMAITDSRWAAAKNYAVNIANYTSQRHTVYPIPSSEMSVNNEIKQHRLW